MEYFTTSYTNTASPDFPTEEHDSDQTAPKIELNPMPNTPYHEPKPAVPNEAKPIEQVERK